MWIIRKEEGRTDHTCHPNRSYGCFVIMSGSRNRVGKIEKKFWGLGRKNGITVSFYQGSCVKEHNLPGRVLRGGTSN